MERLHCLSFGGGGVVGGGVSVGVAVGVTVVVVPVGVAVFVGVFVMPKMVCSGGVASMAMLCTKSVSNSTKATVDSSRVQIRDLGVLGIVLAS
jgi:hypothetical protein